MAGLLMVIAGSAAVSVLGHLFRLYTLPYVTLAVTAGVGLWALVACYMMIVFALGISTSTREQVRLLENYRLLRWASGAASVGSLGALAGEEVGKNGTIAGILYYIQQHDNPPTILGIAVTPELLHMLNHYVVSFLAAGLASYVTDHLHGSSKEGMAPDE